MNLEVAFGIFTNIWLGAEILIALFTTTRKGQGKIQDRGSQIIVWVVILASFTAEGWMRGFFRIDMPGGYSWLRPTAFGFLILGLGVRALAIVRLGRAFSANVAVRTGQKLERSGLYRLVRHPSYLGLELILLALALHSRIWPCFAVAFVPSTLAVLYRIHVEESALRSAFGAAYADYSRNTKRLIPGIY